MLSDGSPSRATRGDQHRIGGGVHVPRHVPHELRPRALEEGHDWAHGLQHGLHLEKRRSQKRQCRFVGFQTMQGSRSNDVQFCTFGRWLVGKQEKARTWSTRSTRSSAWSATDPPWLSSSPSASSSSSSWSALPDLGRRHSKSAMEYPPNTFAAKRQHRAHSRRLASSQLPRSRHPGSAERAPAEQKGCCNRVIIQ